MALANVTARAAMAVEDVFYLLQEGNNTNGSWNNSVTLAHYPSGYTLPQIVVASIVVTILMITVVVGNMLVIIAITTEKALKNIQNWFIASLAVADFFLGLIIMPFSLANELMGYWIFGHWWCDVHSAMDVLLSTASIMNLCLISLDRYWSITQAIEYLKKRTPVRAMVMITAVWLLSALICIPPLLGWKVEQQPDKQYPQCQLSEEVGYVLYSALGSFYIPSCIMVFVYIRIYFAAKARARRGIRKQPRRPQPQDAVTSFTTTTTVSHRGPVIGSGKNGDKTVAADRQIALIEAHPRPIIPTVTCDLASDISTSEAGDMSQDMTEDKDTLKVFGGNTGSTLPLTPGSPLNLPLPQSPTAATTTPVQNSPLSSSSLRGSQLSINGCTELQALAAQQAAQQQQQQQTSVTVITTRLRQPSTIDTDMVSEFDPSSSDSGVVSRCANVKPLKLKLCKPIFGRMGGKSGGGGGGGGSKGRHDRKGKGGVSGSTEPIVVEQVVPRIQKPRDPEREKRRIARKKEKRATLILGLIMGSFIACWLPFFCMYILRLVWDIPGIAFSTAFWLGYMNSALNPVIYTIFNKDFRRAFRRILFK